MSGEQFLRALARFDSDIKRGAIAFDYKTGACAPVQATQVRSWGAACPSGYCPPEDLPAALNRWFAGDRAGCRELPYTVRLDSDGDPADPVAVTQSFNALVTMCPTRIITYSAGSWLINQIRIGNQNQLVGGPVPAEAFATDVFASVPIVPDCMRSGQPVTIDATILPGGENPGGSLWVVFLGPMVG